MRIALLGGTGPQGRGLALRWALAGVEVERRADANLHGVDSISVFVGESILFGAPQTDENDARTARVDSRNGRRVFLFGQRSKRR